MKVLKKIFLIFISFILVGYIVLYLFDFLSHKELDEIDPKKQNVLRIATANINYENPNQLQTSKQLAKVNADILMILEYTGSNFNISYFENNGYKIIVGRPINSPQGIFTIIKNDISAKGELTKIPYMSPCQMPLATIRFKINDEYISIWGVHAPPPVPACKYKTSFTIKKLATYIINGQLVKNFGISQAGDLIIMVGDFNIFWFHPAISELKQSGLIDSYAKLHFIPATTWSPFSWFPQFIGLDYIFCSDKIKVINSFVIKINGSDHGCVITDISYRNA